MTLDPEQRILRLVGGGNGWLYEARVTGELRLWRHTGWQTGAATWIGPLQIGSGWNDYVELLADFNGGLYPVYGDGTMRRYQWVVTNTATGAGYWAAGSGAQVASGCDVFKRMFGGPGGAFYGVKADGTLWRAQYASGVMSNAVQIGTEWQTAAWLGGDDNGVIYGVRYGQLVWWRYTNGTWVNGAPLTPIGDNVWDQRMTRVLTVGGNGVLYHVELSQTVPPGPDGDLYADRLTNYTSVLPNGSASWAYNGKQVGSDWTVERWAAVQGYASPLSVPRGGSTAICVSSPHLSLTASVWRHAPGASPTQVVAPAPVTGGIQLVQSGYRAAGCGWSPTLTVPVDQSWPSGIYSARVSGPKGMYRQIPFVVKPAAPTAQLAVLLPSNTYNAYNGWGGHDQYTMDMPGSPRTLTLDRPSYTLKVEPSGVVDVDLYSDLALLRWLSSNGYSYDVWTDQDLDANPSLPGSYQAVVLGSHPEYLTVAERQALLGYVSNGGRLVYTGGNGVWEPVTISGDAVTFREPDGQRHEYIDSGLPPSQVLGVTFHDANPRTTAAYQVVADHPILAGTGLVVGSTFGASGFNLGGSGIEYDWADPAYQGRVIAKGQNPDGGADMTWTTYPGGGWVFAAASLTFNGCLSSDAAASALMCNVINEALA